MMTKRMLNAYVDVMKERRSSRPGEHKNKVSTISLYIFLNSSNLTRFERE